MSLGILFKSPEGIVLAADSRVTLQHTEQGPQSNVLIATPAYYDNATKILNVAEQPHVGAITVGLGALGNAKPRTANSFIPEFEKELEGTKRLSVIDFARKLGDFYLRQWKALMPQNMRFEEMIFLVGGYNEDEIHGRTYRLSVPSAITPIELHADDFGLSWEGQSEITARLINSVDVSSYVFLQKKLNIKDDDMSALVQEIKNTFGLKIPYQFISLQDAIDLSILLIQTTAQLQKYETGIRGVGGPIDVATISGAEGFKFVQHKALHGEVGGHP